MTRYILRSLDAPLVYFDSVAPLNADALVVTNVKEHAARFDFMTTATLQAMELPGRWEAVPVEDKT